MTSSATQVPADGHAATSRNDSILLSAAAILLTTALLFGGSSADDPLRVMLIEIVGIATLATVLIRWRGPGPSVVQLVGVTLVLGVPLLQLIPLPPSIWMALPGREVASDVARFVDPEMSRPLTLDSNKTFQVWLSLFVPVAMFFATWQLCARDRARLAALVMAIALVSLLLGLLQMFSGTSLYLYGSTHVGLPLGLFSNRNHQAALLYIAMAMTFVLAATPRYRGMQARLVLFGLAAVFYAGIFATESRAGSVLGALVLMLGGLSLISRRPRPRTVVLAIIGIIAIGFLLSRSGVVQSLLARFARYSTDGRYDFWPDVIYATQAYFPAGSGLGTFVKSYQANEQLTAVTVYFVNHAHNEYLELVLEAGVLGLLLIAFFVLLLGVRAWHIAFRLPAGIERAIAGGALIALVCLMLHAFIDYPARTFGLMTCSAMLLAMLYPKETNLLTSPGLTGKRGARTLGQASGASAREQARPSDRDLPPSGGAEIVGLFDDRKQRLQK